jgi:acyl dehydratase
MTTLDQVKLGQKRILGSHLFTADGIITFARAYDPQPFHVDEAAAKASHFGGLCASGWHTAAVWMRLMVDDIRAQGVPAANLGPSPGFQDMRWLKPVYAGDTITYSTTPIEKRALASRPEWGLLSSLNAGVNQHGIEVFRFTGLVFVKRG